MECRMVHEMRFTKCVHSEEGKRMSVVTEAKNTDVQSLRKAKQKTEVERFTFSVSDSAKVRLAWVIRSCR